MPYVIRTCDEACAFSVLIVVRLLEKQLFGIAAGESGTGTGADTEDETGFVLSDVQLRVQPGELVVVVGSVGSGKSSFLRACLGEMEWAQNEGDTSGLQWHLSWRHGTTIAYAPQTPWIRNRSLRDNIICFASSSSLDQANR